MQDAEQPKRYRFIAFLNGPGHKVIFTAKPFCAFATECDSLLRPNRPTTPPPADVRVKPGIQAWSPTPSGVLLFTGIPNESGFVGRFVSETFLSLTLQEAEKFAFDSVSSWLSQTSLQLDVGLEIGHTETEDLSTGQKRVWRRRTYSPVTYIGKRARPNPELIILAALYREAISTNSNPYAFLCFYKILQSSSDRRKTLSRSKKTKGTYVFSQQNLPVNDEEVANWCKNLLPSMAELPRSELLEIVPPEVRGWNFERVVVDRLRDIRNAIGHTVFFDQQNVPFNHDERVSEMQIGAWLPLMRCMVRARLKSDFAWYVDAFQEP